MKARTLFLGLLAVFAGCNFVFADVGTGGNTRSPQSGGTSVQGTPGDINPHANAPTFDINNDSGDMGDDPHMGRITPHAARFVIVYLDAGFSSIGIGPQPWPIVIALDGSRDDRTFVCKPPFWKSLRP